MPPLLRCRCLPSGSRAWPPSPARPHGYPHATNIAALVNAGWLLILNVAIAVAAIQRLVTGTHRVDALPVLIVSSIAAAVMLAAARVLGGQHDADLNIKAVLLDTIADAAAAAGVAASGAVILAVGGWYWLDPAVALVIAVLISYHAQKLAREVIFAIRSPRPAPLPEAQAKPMRGQTR